MGQVNWYSELGAETARTTKSISIAQYLHRHTATAAYTLVDFSLPEIHLRIGT